MGKLLLSLAVSLFILSASPAWTLNYNYITAEQLHAKLTAQEQLSLLDIQYEGAYKAGHFPQATAIYTYPVKTAASAGQIDAKLAELQPEGPVIVLSHRGGGAMRAFDHLKRKGIEETRLLILKMG